MKRFGDRLGAILRIVAVGLVLCLLLVPVCLALAMSFDSRAYLGPFPPPSLSLRWYDAFFSTDQYLRGFGWSLLIAFIAVTISTTAGVAAALFLHGRPFKGREVLLAVFLSPFIIPQVVIGFGILIAFSHYGIRDPFVSLTAAHIIIVIPFTIRLTLVGLQGVRQSLLEAAMTLGARRSAVFWQVTFPLIRPGIVASAIFAASISMGESAASVFLVTDRLQTLPLALLSQMRNNFNLTIAAASALLIILTALSVLVLDRLVGLDRITGRGAYSRL